MVNALPYFVYIRCSTTWFNIFFCVHHPFRYCFGSEILDLHVVFKLVRRFLFCGCLFLLFNACIKRRLIFVVHSKRCMLLQLHHGVITKRGHSNKVHVIATVPWDDPVLRRSNKMYVIATTSRDDNVNPFYYRLL